MAEPTPSQEEIKPGQTPGETPNNGQPSSGGNQDHAAARLAADKEALQKQLDEANAKIRDMNIEKLPEDEQIETGFRQLYSEQVINSFTPEEFAKLSPTVQNQLRNNPWALTPQEEIDTATRFVEDNPGEYYKEAAKVAKTYIKQAISEVGTTPEKPNANPEDKNDPTLSPGGGAQRETGSYSEGELRAMAQTEPDRFEKIMAASRSK